MDIGFTEQQDLGRGGTVHELLVLDSTEMITAGPIATGPLAAVPAVMGVADGLFEVGDDAEGMSWQERSLCAQTDPEAFFPAKGGSTREAKQVCVGCEVRAECLESALANDERFGSWGGLSEREGRMLKKRAV
jgi:WhiB family redox-sensing transcriptional regulator